MTSPIKESVKYNFTLTLQPMQYVKDPLDQYLDTFNILVNILRTELHVVNVSLCYELTEVLNIHYHGVMTVNLNKYKNSLVVNKFYNSFRKKKIRQYFGSTRCYQTQHEGKALAYITKDLFKSYALMNRTRYPLIIDDYKLDDHFTFQMRFTEWLKTARQEYLHDVIE